MPLLSLAQFPRTYREMSAVRGTRRASRRCGTGVGAPYASSTNGGANTNTNSVFCADNVKLDKAFSNSQSDSEALTALKSNQSVTNEMSAHLPPGTVGNEAKQILSAAQQGIAKNDVSVLNSVSNNNYGGDIDTYSVSTRTGTRFRQTSLRVKAQRRATLNRHCHRESATPPIHLPLFRTSSLIKTTSTPSPPKCRRFRRRSKRTLRLWFRHHARPSAQTTRAGWNHCRSRMRPPRSTFTAAITTRQVVGPQHHVLPEGPDIPSSRLRR